MNSKDFDTIARRLASSHGTVRTAGKIEFVKDSGPVRRDIRVEGFEWTPENLKNLAKILWAAQRSHSYAIAAYRLFSKIPSSGFSPDGLLGGRGYIQAVKEMRQSLATAVETMSSFTDTVHDEINAEHWKRVSDDKISGMVQDAEQVKGNPEGFIEDEFEEDEGFDPGPGNDDDEEDEKPISNPVPEDFDEGFVLDDGSDDDSDEEEDDDFFSQIASENAFADAKDLKKLKYPEPEEPGSELPSDSGEQGQGKTVSEMVMNTTSSNEGGYSSAMARVFKAYRSYHEARVAGKREPISFEQFIERFMIAGGSSSIPVETLPGPRVKHIGPGASGTESGGYGDSFGSDDLAGDGLPSGTNMSKPLYEDWTMDGVTGDDNSTDGDETVLKISSRVAISVQDSYSWLPGASNDRNLNYYERGLTDDDLDWMRQQAAPILPAGIEAPKRKVDPKDLWEVEF